MPLIDAALGFALTMFAVASLVTVTVRVIRTTATKRKEQLATFLREYLETELKPVLETELDVLTGKMDARIDTAIRTKVTGVTGGGGMTRAIEELTGGVRMEVSTKEMLEWLTRSDLGKELASSLQDKGEALFARLGERYEALGDRFTASFRKDARKWTTFIAVVVALVLYFVTIVVLSTYMTATESREAVLSQQEAILDRYQGFLNEQADSQSVRELSVQISTLREATQSLEAGGFPIGWKLFPWCRGEQTDGRCGGTREGIDAVLLWPLWVIGLALTGVLAGLGGPFWHDIVTGITHSAQLMRGGRRRTSGTEAVSGGRA